MDLPSAPPRAPTDSELTANDVRQIFLFTPNSLASERQLEHVRREELLAVGVVALFFWAGAINVGMVLGVLPVVGVPLPLLSYGGSSLLTCMIGLGLLMNISMRRYVF